MPPGTGETGRNAYLAAIDGLAFGDDPSQGVVRDNAFIHPKLGFAFQAPDGFTLDNQSAALIGVGETGGEALRLDSIAIPESTPVTSAIGSDWIDGVKTTSIESKKIDGLEAATAVAQGDQWSFRLGAVRLNGRLYRLIFAAHDLSPAVIPGSWPRSICSVSSTRRIRRWPRRKRSRSSRRQTAIPQIRSPRRWASCRNGSISS